MAWLSALDLGTALLGYVTSYLLRRNEDSCGHHLGLGLDATSLVSQADFLNEQDLLLHRWRHLTSYFIYHNSPANSITLGSLEALLYCYFSFC